MKFKDLKTFVETCGLPDNARVLVPGSDHDYRVAYMTVTDVSWSREHGTWNEFFSPSHQVEDEVCVKAIVIS